jgi:hypothetical protein
MDGEGRDGGMVGMVDRRWGKGMEKVEMVEGGVRLSTTTPLYIPTKPQNPAQAISASLTNQSNNKYYPRPATKTPAPHFPKT